MSMLWCALYLFGMLGTALFGGVIYRSQPLLDGTDFKAEDYFANNFNDLGSAFITLFELLVVNNW